MNTKEKTKKLRVAVYCRVGNISQIAQSSFYRQEEHLTHIVNANPNWELAGIYSDEGSGLHAKNRPAFMELIDDCEQGGIDLILTKSISRLSRSALDLFHYVRLLRNLGVEMIFEQENIRTYSKDVDVILETFEKLAKMETEIRSDWDAEC